MKDFFISYTGADRPWAEWIAWFLEAAGYSVFIDVWDFRPGTNFALQMQKGTQAKQTIAVFSEAYFNANYTNPEWAAIFAADPLGENRKLIPVRVEEFEPTGLLKPIIYVDFVGVAEAEAKEQLLAALKVRGKPTTAPSFPGGTPVEARAKPTKITFPGTATQQAPETNPTPSVASINTPKTTASKTPLTPRERLALSRRITGLMVQDFNDLLLLLDPPAGLIPPPSTQQGDRTYALLTWAQSITGPGLGAVQAALNEIAPQ